MKKLITFTLVLFTGILTASAQYYCQVYHFDNKLRFYTTANPAGSSRFYTLDVSADAVNAWGVNPNFGGPTGVAVYNNKVFVSFAYNGLGGVLIYNMSDIYPVRTAAAPMVINP